jgi:predicted transcriptional regulator of viral defense system
MHFLDFKKQFENYPIFSTREIKKIFPEWNKMNLRNWQQKNYILKLRNNWYAFTDKSIDEHFLFYIANKIYSPSYISMDTALYHYGFIPEAVFSIQSVSTLKTMNFSNKYGHFYYSNIKKDNFFGYKLLTENNITVKIADVEKAVLDFLYLRKDIKRPEDIKSLRFNIDEIKKQIDFDKIIKYADILNSKILNKKLNYLFKIINA